jgi:hypothetical protein
MVSSSFCGIVESTKLTSLEDLLEMELLSKISDVNNAVSFESFETMAESSDISSVIVKSTVRLLNNQRNFLLGHEDADGASVFNSDFPVNKLVNERTEHRIVEGLSKFFKLDVESIVDLVELNTRDSAEHFPSSTAMLISTL